MAGSGDSINTGPGGFDVDGQEYTYDTGLTEADGGSQGPRKKVIDVSAGYLDANGAPKDLTKKTKTTLSQYLSKQTSGQGTNGAPANEYPIDQTYAEESITTKTGKPALQSPANAPPLNASAFAPNEKNLSSVGKNYPTISPKLQKGKSDQTNTDGNDLLAGIPGDVDYTADAGKLTGTGATFAKPVSGHADTSGLVKPYISAVLSSNRFVDASSAFNVSGVSDNGFNPGLTQQSKMGVYDKNAPSLTPGRMAVIGPLLTMRAGKELGAASPGANPNSGGTQAAALLPGFGQLGATKIDAKLLEAADVLASLTTDELDSAFVLSIGDKSWGQLNNTDDPFSGTDALGMLLLSTVLVAGVELLLDGLSVLFGLITPQLKTPVRDKQGRYSMGEYFPGTKQAGKANAGGIGGALSSLTSLNFGALLGVQPTNYPFQKAMTTGMNAFFGIPDSSSGGGIGLNQLVGALTSSTDSPGFNSVVARAIIRSSLTIVDQLKKIGGNVMNAITQVLSLIDTIRSSKLIAACNVFATLGDSILSSPKDFIDPDTTNVKTSQMDSNPDEAPGAEVSKNRLRGTLKLAWAGNRAGANLLLPASIAANSLVVKKLGQPDPFMGVGQDSYSKVTLSVTQKDDYGRIKPEDALAFEDQLAASYVPFYFHDVRTNEMVSFHAFLASLTDDYTAAYNKEEGFGRVEPVKIYKGTERKIQMSFYIIATSLLDLDEMYVKINKLTTLMYPQYTQGITLGNKDKQYSFTQPFSQLVGASPLIRLRLGDLLRSNYSVFNLGRLFGMGNPNFMIDGQSLQNDSTLDTPTVEGLAKSLRDAQANPNSETYYPIRGSYPYIPDPGSLAGGLGLPVPLPKIPGFGGDDGPKFAPKFDCDAGIFKVKAKSLHPDNPQLMICEVAFRDDDVFVKQYKDRLKAWDKMYNNDDSPMTKVIGGTYVFPAYSLYPTDLTKTNLSQQLSALNSVTQGNSTYTDALTKFLSPDNNAVVKSFADTAGKGLAGNIESMSFDWFDKVTWEVQQNFTAPKMCKVSLTFSPLHDISPGIDHLGFNRGAVYPVGSMGPSS